MYNAYINYRNGANKMLTHKEMTANIRKLIKASHIKALVRKQECCGSKVIQVNCPAFGIDFTSEEQNSIRKIAVSNGLTWVRGMPIDVDQNTSPSVFNFYFNGA